MKSNNEKKKVLSIPDFVASTKIERSDFPAELKLEYLVEFNQFYSLNIKYIKNRINKLKSMF